MTGIQRKSLDGVRVIDHEIFPDSRGFFNTAFQTGDLSGENLHEYQVRQMNHSFSSKNVLRGLHREPWQKVIYIPSGKAEICVVNLIPSHKEFADYFLLTIGNFDGGRKSVHIPQGFANAFHCLEDTHYINLVSKVFEDLARKGARWDDPLLHIDWTYAKDPILSAQDLAWPPLENSMPDLT